MASLPFWLEELKQADPAGYANLQRYFSQQEEDPATESRSQVTQSSINDTQGWTLGSIPMTIEQGSYPVEQNVQGRGMPQHGLSFCEELTVRGE